MKRIAIILAGTILVSACTVEASDPNPQVSELSGTLLIGNKAEDSVSFVDLATGEEIVRRDTGDQPHEIAISPDGQLAAVVSYGGETIDIFAIANREKIETISLAPNKRPHGIVWLDDGRIMATTEGSDSIAIVSPPTGEEQKRTVNAIPTGQKGSHMLVVPPDKSRAFVTNMQSGTVSVLDLVTGKKITDLSAGTEPEGLAITPDGKTVWVADRRGDLVRIFDAENLTEIASLKTGKVPIRVAISPDGKTAVTSNYGDGGLGLFDVATREPTRSINVSGSPEAGQVTILFSDDGRQLYVAETGKNQIAEVDMSTGEVIRRLPAGENGDGLGLVMLPSQTK